MYGYQTSAGLGAGHIAFPDPQVAPYSPSDDRHAANRRDVYAAAPSPPPRQPLPPTPGPVPPQFGGYGGLPSTGGTSAPYPVQDIGRAQYQDPYVPQAEADRMAHNTSPTVGPWDSASQRSVHMDFSTPPPDELHNLLGPTTVPLAAVPGPSKPFSHVKGRPSKTLSTGGLSYIDEEGAYYRSAHPRPASTMLLSNFQAGPSGKHEDVEMRGLIPNAERGTASEDTLEGYHGKFNDYAEQPDADLLEKQQQVTKRNTRLHDWLLFPTGLDRLLGLFGVKAAEYPLEQAIEKKRNGLGRQRWPVASWLLTIAMTGVMIYELLRNRDLTGSVIATKPQFNYMIGPQPEVLINMGARFIPCMKYVDALPPTFQLACLGDTNNPPTTSCPISDICGNGLAAGTVPNQYWRFIVPIFLHVGVIHLLVNMLAQMIIGSQVEREMGTLPFLIVYFASGVYGFVLGGNFSRTGVPSVGASGALFGVNACILVDLLLHWKYEERPKLKAFFIAIEFAIGIAIGYIPNAVDGLAHLGGFAMGLLTGVILYPSISETKRHKYIVWAVRVIALIMVILAFVLTIKNFCMFCTGDMIVVEAQQALTMRRYRRSECCLHVVSIPLMYPHEREQPLHRYLSTTTSTRRSWDLL